jgi:hypothetical protein
MTYPFIKMFPASKMFIIVLPNNNNMGRLEDIEDIIERMGDDSIDNISDLTDSLERQSQTIDEFQDNLIRTSMIEVAQLYRDEDIPPETARKFENMVDGQLQGAGLEPYFSRDDVDRPSEIYDDGTWLDRRGFVTLVGAAAAGATTVDVANMAEGDEQGGGIEFGTADLDGFGYFEDNENHAAAEGKTPANSAYGVQEVEVEDSDLIAGYIEDEVEGNPLLSAERNWGDLLSQYDFEEGEFFSDSDRSLNSIEIIYDENPREHSEYGVTVNINGDNEFDTRTLKDDKAAENALNYFEVEE